MPYMYQLQAEKGLYGITMYEKVSLYGWFGMLLAVQQQPIIVAVQATSPTFLSYTSVGLLAS